MNAQEDYYNKRRIEELTKQKESLEKQLETAEYNADMSGHRQCYACGELRGMIFRVQAELFSLTGKLYPPAK